MTEYITMNDNHRIKTIIRKKNDIDELSIKNMTTSSYEDKKVNKNFYNNLNKVIKGNNTELPHISETYWKNNNKKEQQFTAYSILGGQGNETVICDTDQDVDKLLECIKKQLESSEEMKYDNIKDNYELTLSDDTKINVTCFINIITNINENICEKNTIDKLREDNELKINKFFPSENVEINKRLDFDNNMYKYILSITKFIAENTEFKNMSDENKEKIITTLCSLIAKEIEYNTNLILNNKILQDKYYKINYNLLFLHIILTMKYINKNDTNKLKELYKKLLTTAEENIKEYQKWKNKIIETDTNKTDLSEKIENIIKQLKTRLEQLEKDNELYRKEIDNMNNLKTTLEPNVDQYMKDMNAKLSK